MLLLDFLLFIMIIVCVGYCWMLNHRIRDLQNSRIEFARMIKELNASVEKAETNIKEMTELSKVTSAQIKEVVEEAKEKIEELSSKISLASDVSNKMSKNIANYEPNLDQEKELDDSYENAIKSKPGEKFSEDDLAQLEDEKASYTNHLKTFIHNITKKPENTQNLNQTGYYDTLRKINAKK